MLSLLSLSSSRFRSYFPVCTSIVHKQNVYVFICSDDFIELIKIAMQPIAWMIGNLEGSTSIKCLFW